MRLLLDTHVALWSAVNERRIPGSVRRVIADPQHSVFVSAASIAEIAIKNRGKLRMPFSAPEAITNFRSIGFDILDVTAEHAAAMEHIAVAHPDPFDRLILAQALTEPMRLVTADAALASYVDIAITW